MKLSFETMKAEQKAKIYEELNRLKEEYSFWFQETADFKKEVRSFKTASEG